MRLRPRVTKAGDPFMSTAYDEVRYPNWPNSRTHPALFGVVAQLMGRRTAPPDRCRVLELACSEGVNLASMAMVAPRSSFVGVDLAETAIARGRRTLALAGLDNVELRAGDLTDPGCVAGEFDYIIAHGVYAWTPEPVRRAVMARIGAHLAPDGVAFVSYNAYPGCRTRQTVRDYLLRMQDIEAATDDRMAKARAALEYQIAGWSPNNPAQKALIDTAQGALQRPIEVLFHDEMGEVWEPQFLDSVVAAAQAVGLDYLADAQPESLGDCLFPSARFDAARPMTGGDWARYEQLKDFTDLRAFRWSLFVRAGAPLDRIATPERLAGLWATASLARMERRADQKAHVFRADNKAEFETDSDDLAELLDALSAQPAMALDRCVDREDLAEAMLRLYVSGVVTLSAAPPAFTLTPGERPRVSPLARAQAAQGEKMLASLHHRAVRMDDPFWYAFLQQLDGKAGAEDLVRYVCTAAGKTEPEAREIIPRAVTEIAQQRLIMA